MGCGGAKAGQPLASLAAQACSRMREDFGVEGDALYDPGQQWVEVRRLLVQARARERYDRLKRLLPLVGRWRLFLLRWYDELIHRPSGRGFQRCREQFVALASADGSAAAS